MKNAEISIYLIVGIVVAIAIILELIRVINPSLMRMFNKISGALIVVVAFVILYVLFFK